MLETSKTDPKPLLFPPVQLRPLTPHHRGASSHLTKARSLADAAWGHAGVSNSPWTQAGSEWSTSVASAAPSPLHPTPLSCVPHLCPPVLVMASWLCSCSHRGGTRKPDSFSQNEGSTPTAGKQPMPCLMFLQVEAETKRFDFQTAAGIYRVGCERKTSLN